jgi:hypothetical protein
VEVLIGVDIGQKVDPTAIAVLELEWRDGRERVGQDDHYVVRYLERLALGAAYPEIAERLAAIVRGVETKVERIRVPLGAGAYEVREDQPHVSVFVDATGVGQPVVDLLVAAGTRPVPCYFTHGDRRTVEEGRVTIGKAWLVSRLQALAQSGRLHVPKTSEAEAMRRELMDYEIRVDQDANDRYGAFRVGTHDDLVTALGLAVQVGSSRAGVMIV